MAERVRRRVQGIFGRRTGGGSSRALSGHEADGTLSRAHDHATFLPTDEDGDGRIDHVTVVTRGGLGPEEERALECLRVVFPGEGAAEVRACLADESSLDEARKAARSPGGPGGLLFDESAVRRSETPYMLARRPRRGAYGPEEQLVRDLALYGHATPVVARDSRSRLLRTRINAERRGFSLCVLAPDRKFRGALSA